MQRHATAPRPTPANSLRYTCSPRLRVWGFQGGSADLFSGLERDALLCQFNHPFEMRSWVVR